MDGIKVVYKVAMSIQASMMLTITRLDIKYNAIDDCYFADMNLGLGNGYEYRIYDDGSWYRRD